MATNQHNAGTLETLALTLARFLQPLSLRFAEGTSRAFLAELGLRLPSSVESLSAFKNDTTNIAEGVKGLVPLIDDLTKSIEANDFQKIITTAVELSKKIAQIIQGITQLATGLKSLSGSTGISPAVLNAFADKLPKRLFDYLLFARLKNLPMVVQVLEVAGIVTSTIQNKDSLDPALPPFTERDFSFEKLSAFLKSPGDELKNFYDWGKSSFDGSKLLPVLYHLLQEANVPVIYDDTVLPPVLDIVIGELTAKKDVTPPGIQLKLVENINVDVSPSYEQDDWRVEAILSNQLKTGTKIIIQPDGKITFLTATPAATGDIAVKWTGGKTDGEPYILFGQAGGPRIELRQVVLQAGAKLVSDEITASGGLKIGGEIKGGKVVIKLEGADGFLQTLASGLDIENNFDLGFGISSKHGIFFYGSSQLNIKLPVHLDLGPITLTGLLLQFGIKGSTFPINIAADIKSSFGPLTAIVEEVGIKAVIELSEDQKGNLGPVDFKLGFKPPNGVGLSVDAGVVRGGGFLRFDFDKGEYSGVFELSIIETITVKAIGIITTKMPDGSKGFSLLIIITAEFATGIQLGFGFTLLGVGGLLGLNRTMLLEPLAAGIKTGAVNSIMFPPDPIANAPRIISDLRTYFPPYEGKFLIGPMVKIGWGTPTLVSLSFGVIIEIPGNIAIVGVLKVALPTEEAALLVINVAFLGALEFDKSRIWFFASMYDSRILFMTMEGDMGLLMDYGNNPNFVLSVGGFHPQFNPPPLPFPNPRRIHIDVLRNPLQRITVENYFAVTTNTVQFGASAELFYGIDDFNLHGSFSFDALFQFSPFHFIIEISFSVGLDVFGAGVFSVNLKFSLAGPGPFRAQGTATLSIDLWLFSIDISVDFDITWGEADNPKLPSIEAIPLLIAEYNKADNWRAGLPTSSNLFVSLRKLDDITDGMVLHPLGTLQVSQRAVPLSINVDKVGNNPVSDAHLFSVGVNTAGLAKTKSTKEKFAIAQFQNLSDAQKLSSPAFQDIDSGLELSAAGKQLGSGKVVKRVVRYEVKIIDGFKRYRFKWFKNIGTLFFHWLNGAAVARSPLSYARKTALVPTAEDDRIKVQQPGYVIAGIADNKLRVGTTAFASEAQARDYYDKAVTANSAMADEIHVIPAFEAS